MPRRTSDDKDEDAEIIPFPVPRTPPPSNPEPKCTCGPSGKPCPACNS
jgi:hypothetical protein